MAAAGAVATAVVVEHKHNKEKQHGEAGKETCNTDEN
jgi:hypothetical protein